MSYKTLLFDLEKRELTTGPPSPSFVSGFPFPGKELR